MGDQEAVEQPSAAVGRPARTTARRRGGRGPLWVTTAVVAGIAVLAIAGTAAAGSGGDTYRTAAVVRGAVDATVTGSGTITPVNQADLTFAIAGTVSAVSVTVGQHVTVGQPLAQLDVTSLQAQVASAQATLATAQNKLATDESGQSGSSAATPASSVSGTSAGLVTISNAAYTTGTTTVPASARPSVTSASVADLQAQLVADQHHADVALTQEKAAISTETAACASPSGTATPAVFQHTGPAAAGTTTTPAPTTTQAPTTTPTPTTTTPAPTTTPGPTTTPAPTTTPPSTATAPGTAKAPSTSGGTTVPVPAAATRCQNAIGSVLAQQLTVSQDLQNVATDEAALDAALATLPSGPAAGTQQHAAGGPAGTGPAAGPGGAATGGATAGSTPAGAKAGSSAATKAPAGGASGGAAKAGSSSSAFGGGGTPVTAEQLAADQASIDADSAAVTVTQQSLGQATMVSTLDGTVGSVTIKPGQTVAAGSSSATRQIVVIGAGTDQVTTSVSDINVGAVTVGAAASVTPSGTNTPIAGKVVSVGVMDTSTGASASYPVVIGLTGTTPSLPDGQGAAVSITTAQVADAVAVPSSAVHSFGATHTVTVLENGKPTTTPVQIGAVGAALTQITSGLNPGDQVVLADLSQALPTTTTGLRAVTGGGGGRTTG